MTERTCVDRLPIVAAMFDLLFIRGTYGRWTEEDLDRALTALQNGDAGLNATAKTYGVPKAPLKRLLDSGNKYANGSKKFSGRPQTLPPVLKTALVKCVLDMESMFGWSKQNRFDGISLPTASTGSNMINSHQVPCGTDNLWNAIPNSACEKLRPLQLPEQKAELMLGSFLFPSRLWWIGITSDRQISSTLMNLE